MTMLPGMILLQLIQSLRRQAIRIDILSRRVISPGRARDGGQKFGGWRLRLLVHQSISSLLRGFHVLASDAERRKEYEGNVDGRKSSAFCTDEGGNKAASSRGGADMRHPAYRRRGFVVGGLQHYETLHCRGLYLRR